MTEPFRRCAFATAAIAGAIAWVTAALAQAPLPTPRSVRITMEALHAAGGVPPGWELALQAGDVKGGRQLFIEQGCVSCHVVQGANLPAVPANEQHIGPELTGMGSHHPAVYFLEAIVNPNAVLIEGPGYIDAEGGSTMPAYPDLTVSQLQDLVAFLSSLTTGGDAACHAPAATFCTICSGRVAPAIALATVGCARSHAKARSSSVRPRDFANDSSRATAGQLASAMRARSCGRGVARREPSGT